MKVVLLAQLPPPSGGIASWTKRMQVAKLKNNWESVIVDERVIGGRGIFGGNTKKNLLIEAKRCWGIWKNLRSELKDKNAVVVHSSIPAGFTGMLREIVCALITKLRKRKFIIHFRCTVPYMVKGGKNLITLKTLVGLSDAVIVLNSMSEQYIHSVMPKKEVCLIPNFVAVDEMIDSPKEVVDTCIVTYVGGVIQEKGCLDIIRCAERMPALLFRLVGAVGDDMKCMNIPKNVTLCGECDKNAVQNELNMADIFIFVSAFHGEGFSNALAEAMAHKLPCVVSKWAANADMIEQNGGYVVDVHDIDGMVDAITMLAENKDLREKMGQWNFGKVTTLYSQECVTSQYVDLYERVLKNEKKNKTDI